MMTFICIYTQAYTHKNVLIYTYRHVIKKRRQNNKENENWNFHCVHFYCVTADSIVCMIDMLRVLSVTVILTVFLSISSRKTLYLANWKLRFYFLFCETFLIFWWWWIEAEFMCPDLIVFTLTLFLSSVLKTQKWFRVNCSLLITATKYRIYI